MSYEKAVFISGFGIGDIGGGAGQDAA